MTDQPLSFLSKFVAQSQDVYPTSTLHDAYDTGAETAHGKKAKKPQPSLHRVVRADMPSRDISALSSLTCALRMIPSPLSVHLSSHTSSVSHQETSDKLRWNILQSSWLVPSQTISICRDSGICCNPSTRPAGRSWPAWAAGQDPVLKKKRDKLKNHCQHYKRQICFVCMDFCILESHSVYSFVMGFF